MALLVIGGHSRSVGKTSVVAGLIAALPEFHWTAAKITQYGHGICSANGEACDCASNDHSWAISEEQSRAGDSDTSRFLAAGADRAYWVRTEQGRLAEAMPALRARIKSANHVILESNSVLKFLRPDLYLTVLDRATAVILHENKSGTAWNDVSLKPIAGKPIFRITPPPYVTPELVEFVRARLQTTIL